MHDALAADLLSSGSSEILTDLGFTTGQVRHGFILMPREHLDHIS